MLNKKSIFSLNARYHEFTESELSQKTGIALERIRSINAGAEPLLSELMCLSKAFDVSLNQLIMSEWFLQQFGFFYDISGGTLLKAVQEKDIELLSFVVSYGLIKSGEDFFYRLRRGIHPWHQVDRDVLAEARCLLLENDMPCSAADISLKNSYYSVNVLDAAVCERETIFKYLFAGGDASPREYFVNFINGLEKEGDRLKLLEVLKKNLKKYVARKSSAVNTNINGVKYVSYDYTDENGVRRISPAWYFRELDGIEAGEGLNSLKKEVIQMQDELFKR